MISLDYFIIWWRILDYIFALVTLIAFSLLLCRENFKLSRGFSFSLVKLIRTLYLRRGITYDEVVISLTDSSKWLF